MRLPYDAEWAGEFIDEHGSFPLGAHDDMVDTTSMALLRFELQKGADYSLAPTRMDVDYGKEQVVI